MATKPRCFRLPRPSAGAWLAITGLVVIAAVVVDLAYENGAWDRESPFMIGLATDRDEADATFRARALAAFPAGSSQEALIEQLRAQGLRQVQAEEKATFSIVKFPCRTAYWVTWHVMKQHVVRLNAGVDHICL